jgi:hypothetical protein
MFHGVSFLVSKYIGVYQPVSRDCLNLKITLRNDAVIYENYIASVADD